jgi:5-methylcytosine-specific restriction endonuclease McrA
MTAVELQTKYGWEPARLRENIASSSCANHTVHSTWALRAGGTHDESNLQSLCHPCHSAKTMAEVKRLGARASA